MAAQLPPLVSLGCGGFLASEPSFLWVVRDHSQGGSHILTQDPC